MNEVQKGNLAGLIAIVLWSTLALFTVLTKNIPPFKLLFMVFFLAYSVALIYRRIKTKRFSLAYRPPLKVWILGIYGLFGYHLCYFLALKNAPALEANLINYLWPLLIVLFSAFLPHEKLKWFHVVGVACGFLGVLVLLNVHEAHFAWEYAKGYFFAFLCAFIWSSYSVLSCYFGNVPTSVIGDFCGVTALLSLIAHGLFESHYIPTFNEFLAVVGLGLGPIGLAFFVWDYAMKKGDIKLIGTFAYMTPLLSTLLLVLFHQAQPHATIWIACGLIMLGSFISSLASKRS